MANRYPGNDYIPFAVRQDNDDVACWRASSNSEVLIVHDYSSPGRELRNSYVSFWDWFRSAIDDMIEFDP